MRTRIAGVVDLRPLSVRKHDDGHWIVVDLGGVIGAPTPFGWAVTPFRPACCWAAAVALADMAAARYRGHPLPSWARAGAPAPGCCGRHREEATP